MMPKKRSRKGDLLAFCSDCELTFRSYSLNLETAVLCHKRMGNCFSRAQRFDVSDTGDYMDGFERFSYEEVPLNLLEPTLGSLFRLDPVQPVYLDHHDDLISETNSQRSIAQ